MHGMEPEPEVRNNGKEPLKRDPVFRLLMGVIIGMAVWNMVVAGSPAGVLFGLLVGNWYFFLLLWFFIGTGRKYRWEAVVFLIIGVICHFFCLWWIATPAYLRSDAQSGLSFIFGGAMAGGIAIVADAVVYVLVQLVRWSMNPEDDSSNS